MRLTIIIFAFLFLFYIPTDFTNAGDIDDSVVFTLMESDTTGFGGVGLVYFFDLRDRETFIQLTYPDLFDANDCCSFPPDIEQSSSGLNATAHVQIFDVGNNCNENNFFDVYTPADTHVYNMRDIQTNDGNPSGVDLPDGAYGIVVISMLRNTAGEPEIADPFGNLRILDNNGYEYRTNAVTFADMEGEEDIPPEFRLLTASSFNFNTQGGVTLSDVVGITLFVGETETFLEWVAQPVQGIFSPFDIDIYDLNEVPFSCRDIIFSCVDEDNPLLEELLAIAQTGNVASFEYGINDAIPHSKGGELLCPGNNISEGFALLIPEPYPETDEFNQIIDQIDGSGPIFFGFIGLNNGNGRGSMDSLWNPSLPFID